MKDGVVVDKLNLAWGKATSRNRPHRHGKMRQATQSLDVEELVVLTLLENGRIP